jgi:hypothetical protein
LAHMAASSSSTLCCGVKKKGRSNRFVSRVFSLVLADSGERQLFKTGSIPSGSPGLRVERERATQETASKKVDKDKEFLVKATLLGHDTGGSPRTSRENGWRSRASALVGMGYPAALRRRPAPCCQSFSAQCAGALPGPASYFPGERKRQLGCVVRGFLLLLLLDGGASESRFGDLLCVSLGGRHPLRCV